MPKSKLKILLQDLDARILPKFFQCQIDVFVQVICTYCPCQNRINESAKNNYKFFHRFNENDIFTCNAHGTCALLVQYYNFREIKVRNYMN